MWYDCMRFITNTEVTSDDVDSHVHNVVDITALNVTETLIEPGSTQHHLTCTEHSVSHTQLSSAAPFTALSCRRRLEFTSSYRHVTRSRVMSRVVPRSRQSRDTVRCHNLQAAVHFTAQCCGDLATGKVLELISVSKPRRLIDSLLKGCCSARA